MRKNVQLPEKYRKLRTPLGEKNIFDSDWDTLKPGIKSSSKKLQKIAAASENNIVRTESKEALTEMPKQRKAHGKHGIQRWKSMRKLFNDKHTESPKNGDHGSAKGKSKLKRMLTRRLSDLSSKSIRRRRSMAQTKAERASALRGCQSMGNIATNTTIVSRKSVKSIPADLTMSVDYLDNSVLGNATMVQDSTHDSLEKMAITLRSQRSCLIGLADLDNSVNLRSRSRDDLNYDTSRSRHQDDLNNNTSRSMHQDDLNNVTSRSRHQDDLNYVTSRSRHQDDLNYITSRSRRQDDLNYVTLRSRRSRTDLDTSITSRPRSRADHYVALRSGNQDDLDNSMTLRPRSRASHSIVGSADLDSSMKSLTLVLKEKNPTHLEVNKQKKRKSNVTFDDKQGIIDPNLKQTWKMSLRKHLRGNESQEADGDGHVVRAYAGHTPIAPRRKRHPSYEERLI